MVEKFGGEWLCRAGGWLVGREEAEGEEGVEGSRGWVGVGADWCWRVDWARGRFVLVVWHGSHP